MLYLNEFNQLIITLDLTHLLSVFIHICGILIFLSSIWYCIGLIAQSDLQNNDSLTTNANSDEFILIGITGRKKSGKDTIGKFLINEYGFVRVAFADALKEACKIVFGFTDEQVYDDRLKEIVDEYWNHSPREILQKVGTELFRDGLPKLCEHISNDIWIRSVDRKIKNLRKEGHTRIVITDVRFPNELDYIQKLNTSNSNGFIGESWKVSRPSLLKDIDPNLPVHASEALIDDFECDTKFVNDGTIDELCAAVNTEMDDIFHELYNTGSNDDDVTINKVESTLEDNIVTNNVVDDN